MSMNYFDQSGQKVEHQINIGKDIDFKKMDTKVEGDWWPGFIGSTIKECVVLSDGKKNPLYTIDILTEDDMLYSIHLYDGMMDFAEPRKKIAK